MIAQKVVDKLIEKKYTISLAESCTGGAIVAKLVEIPSASHVLNMSFVTYSMDAKSQYLDIPLALITSHGVVSEYVATAMALGAAKATKANVGVGITGVAGPTGSEEAPIGTVWVGFWINGQSYAFCQKHVDKSRKEVIACTVQFALSKLLELI